MLARKCARLWRASFTDTPVHVGQRFATTRHAHPPVIRLVLLGAPGSGKGTIAGRLRRDYGPAIISCGDVLRSHIAAGTEEGRLAEREMSRGGLVSDEIALRVMGVALEEMTTKHCVLDGFPRTVGQALSLDKLLAASGQRVSLAINLAVSEKSILNRVSGRWIHPPSGRIYNLAYNPPRVPFHDDDTGEPLVQRDDDRPDIIRGRLRDFQKLATPLRQYYADQSKLASIAGETSDEIYAVLQEIVTQELGWKPDKQTANVTGDEHESHRRVPRN